MSPSRPQARDEDEEEDAGSDGSGRGEEERLLAQDREDVDDPPVYNDLRERGELIENL